MRLMKRHMQFENVQKGKDEDELKCEFAIDDCIIYAMEIAEKIK